MRLEAQATRPHTLTNAQFDSITKVSSQLCWGRRDAGGARPWLAAQDDMLTMEPSRATACTFTVVCARAPRGRSYAHPNTPSRELAQLRYTVVLSARFVVFLRAGCVRHQTPERYQHANSLSYTRHWGV